MENEQKTFNYFIDEVLISHKVMKYEERLRKRLDRIRIEERY